MIVLGRFASAAFGIGACAFFAIGACGDQTVQTREPPNFTPDGSAPDSDSPTEAGVPTREGIVRVATFNTRRFFDTVCDSGNCTAGGFEDVPTPEAFAARAVEVAKGIQIMQPDIIALEEIENEKAFGGIRDELTKLGMTYSIARLGETGLPGSVDVAVLAKGSLTAVKTHRDTPLKRPDGSATTFSRELLEIRMSFGTQAVVMFAAHFKSKVDDDPGRRLAEAQATHEIVAAAAAELPGALVVLGGDLNDFPGSPPIDALEKDGKLLRVASDRPVDKQATYTFQGADQAIDHIFVGAQQKSRYVAASATVFREPKKGFAGSDHGAIAADFSIK